MEFDKLGKKKNWKRLELENILKKINTEKKKQF